MADKSIERFGTLHRIVDNGDTTYSDGVSLTTLLAGEDQANGRTKVSEFPVDADSVLETLQDAVVAAGTGTPINLKGFESVTLRVSATSGTWNGGAQITTDDTNWYYVQLVNLADATTANGAATQFNPAAAAVDGIYTLPNLPFAVSQLRFNVAARTSGAITVTSRKHPR